MGRRPRCGTESRSSTSVYVLADAFYTLFKPVEKENLPLFGLREHDMQLASFGGGIFK
jgi:hypothetical protein